MAQKWQWWIRGAKLPHHTSFRFRRLHFHCLGPSCLIWKVGEVGMAQKWQWWIRGAELPHHTSFRSRRPHFPFLVPSPN